MNEMDTRVILLVEDNPDDQMLTLRAMKLSQIPSQVVVVSNRAEALDYLLGTGAHVGRDPALMPVLILLDLKLGHENGLELLRELRSEARTRLIPVVILTSSREEEDRLSGYELGANSYVRKPVDFNQFSETMRALGLYWLLVNEPPPLPRT
jgi:two-component system response regulator